MRRVMMSLTAPMSAAPTGSRATTCNVPLPGRTMTTMPMKPTTTAVQRRQPTGSPSSGETSMVRNKGPVKVSAMVSAMGMTARAVR